MALASLLKKYLDNRHVAYLCHDLAPFGSMQEAASLLNVPSDSVVQAVLLVDRIGMLLAIIPSDRKVNLEALSRLLGRSVEFATEAQLAKTFRDYAQNAVPPLGEAFGLRSVLDDQLISAQVIYFSAGDGTTAIEIKSQLFFDLQHNARLCANFTDSAAHAKERTPTVATDAGSILEALARAQQLPSMPKLAHELIVVRNNSSAGAKELAAIVQKDPNLAGQVLRYARSPLFGYRGELSSIQDAISRVLGYEMVLNLALGLATARPFKVQRTGPLGLDAFWRHAIYSATLAQSLCSDIRSDRRPAPGLAYLAGLLHNFGHLVIGTLFKKEFSQINAQLAADPRKSVIATEQQFIAMDHTQIAANLFRSWSLPEEVLVAVEHHHDSSYTGNHKEYVALVRLTDQILKNHDMGDGETAELDTDLLEHFGLSELQILMTINRVLEGCEGLNNMAQQVAA